MQRVHQTDSDNGSVLLDPSAAMEGELGIGSFTQKWFFIREKKSCEHWLFLNMIASKRINVLLCLFVFTFTVLQEEQVLLSDCVTGVPAVTVVSQGNDDDDPKLCVIKPKKITPIQVAHGRYFSLPSNHQNSNQLRRLARAPPAV